MSQLTSPCFKIGCWAIGWIGLGALPAPLFAGAWTLPAGTFWGKVAYLKQETDEWYLANPEVAGGRRYAAGTRRPYRFGGHYASQAIFAEGAYGITARLEVGAQLPYFDQKFTDHTRLEPPVEAGFGDLRLSLRWQAMTEPAVFTLKGAVKAPRGDFHNIDGLIPVGEGQWDFDIVAQAGRSFWPLPLYAALDAGYRVRMENRQIAQDPGDEWLLDAELGVHLSDRISLAGKFERVSGKPGTSFGLPNRSLRRRIAYLTPTLFLQLPKRTSLELGLRHSLGGQNHPAGQQWTAGVAGRLE